MSLSRRQFLTLSGIATASAALASCAPVRSLIVGDQAQATNFPPTNNSDWRALSRLTFAPRADELARVAEIGIHAWIEEQLAPATIDDGFAERRVRGLNTLTLDNSLIFAVREENVRHELQQAAILRAIYSQRQLYEVIVDFWSDHLNIATTKADCAWLKTIDDREVIRPHALGNFRDLIRASMHSPAMLKYLDQQENHKGKPNENYARELMELHTLGVDAGYTQRDVHQVARCLTGWSVDDNIWRGQFRFHADDHDDGEKFALGQAITAGGEQDGERVLDLLMAHPALPRFIARKLARRFVSDDPPAQLVVSVAEVFSKTNGDINATLRAIFFSDEFKNASAKFKRPLHFVAGALRQLHAETDAEQPILDTLARMGQPLFQWPTPDGFPDYTAAWDGNVLPRWQFALALASNGLKGTSVNLKSLAESAQVKTMDDALNKFSALLFGLSLPRVARDELVKLFGREVDEQGAQVALAVLISAPQYQWR